MSGRPPNLPRTTCRRVQPAGARACRARSGWARSFFLIKPGDARFLPQARRPRGWAECRLPYRGGALRDRERGLAKTARLLLGGAGSARAPSASASPRDRLAGGGPSRAVLPKLAGGSWFAGPLRAGRFPPGCALDGQYRHGEDRSSAASRRQGPPGDRPRGTGEPPAASGFWGRWGRMPGA